METSYDELRRDPVEAARAFGFDYAPLAPVLLALRGRVLDVGGGLGVTRHWLAPGVSYTLVEPSASWKAPGLERSGGGLPVPARVRGRGARGR
jgi:hypothetical protein